MKKLNIGIVGGSIAGCISAILLSRAGHIVNVYERSKSGLIGRGGGVTTSRKVLEELKNLDILDVDFPASPFNVLRFCKKTPDETYVGRTALDIDIDMHCVNWSGLWENLRKRVPDVAYHRGWHLERAVETDDDKVALSFAGGNVVEVDLVLFADGYNSYGRKLLFPEIDLKYRGYTVWRGVLPEAEVDDLNPLKNHPRYSFTTMPGSFVSFVIPNYTGSNEITDRLVNWAAYIPLPESKLDAFMVDNTGKRRVGTIPSGAMRSEQDAHLKALMKRELPDFYANILAKSEGNQIQQIYTCDLDAYRKGRMCLIGDAGMVVPPMTGAGVFKSFENARNLVQALTRSVDLDMALQGWSTAETKTARRMLELGLQMEEAFIWNTPDFGDACLDECKAWWNRSIDIPTEFSYFAT